MLPLLLLRLLLLLPSTQPLLLLQLPGLLLPMLPPPQMPTRGRIP